MSAVDFYTELPVLKLPITEVFRTAQFSEVPADWFVIISDIKNSTAAVAAGRHNDVNLVAAGSLIAGLNIARAMELEIPFFFGGDGGTLLVPGEILNQVLTALEIHNQNSTKNFGLELHIGSMSVRQLIDAGHQLQIAKTEFGKSMYKAIAIGDGLRFAEQQIKKTRAEKKEVVEGDLNLSGLECRWDRVKPPAEENEIVCYLIEATDPANQIGVFRDVLLKIDEIYGSIEKRNPLSLKRLKLLLSFQKIKKEMLIKYGRWKAGFFTSAFLRTLAGRFFFAFYAEGKEYLNQLVSNADTLIIDGRINTIITGKRDKRIQFTNYLSGEEQKGHLVFGHQISRESIMTCYIENRNQKHMHFVDGADGGYTEASKELKRKLSVAQAIG